MFLQRSDVARGRFSCRQPTHLSAISGTCKNIYGFSIKFEFLVKKKLNFGLYDFNSFAKVCLLPTVSAQLSPVLLYSLRDAVKIYFEFVHVLLKNIFHFPAVEVTYRFHDCQPQSVA